MANEKPTTYCMSKREKQTKGQCIKQTNKKEREMQCDTSTCMTAIE